LPARLIRATAATTCFVADAAAAAAVLLQLPDEVESICTPIMFVCAESDAQFPEKTRTAVQQILEDKSPGVLTIQRCPVLQCVLFLGVWVLG
jgi:dienelactone hydrolase